MNRQVKELNYDIDNLEHLGVIPFTLRKDSLKGEEIISWNTTLRFFNEDMKSSKKRIDYVFGNVKKVGLDDMVMPDQSKEGVVCHEITYDEIEDYYKTEIASKDGTLWNIPKKYDAVFMTRETHFEVLENLGRSISLVFPAADCAIVRMYDKKNDVIGLTHSDILHTTQNIVKEMIEFMKTNYNSNLEDIKIFVGAFAKDGMIWDKYPPFAEQNKEVWQDYIEKIDDTHYNINYGDKLYDQLIECGLSKDNIYFDKDNTVKDNNYFSNNRFKLLNEREGRNLFGITFDSLTVFERQENEEIRTRLK